MKSIFRYLYLRGKYYMKGEDVRVKIVINHFSGGGTKFEFFANSKEVPVHFLSKTKLLRTGTGSLRLSCLNCNVFQWAPL